MQYGFTCRDPCGRLTLPSAIKSSPAYPTIEKDYIRAADSHPTPGCRTIKRKLDHQWAQAAICRCEVAALSWRQVFIHSSPTGQSLTGQLSNNAKSFDQDKISSHTGGLYRHIGNIAASFTHREESARASIATPASQSSRIRSLRTIFSSAAADQRPQDESSPAEQDRH